MDTWIKLYRKFTKWEWFNISEMVHLFIYLLLTANNEDGEWRGVKIKRGQTLTGLNTLHQNTKISYQTLRTCLKRLEKTKEINIQATNKYSIITICNYDSYQYSQQTTNKRPNKQLTSNQQATNNKQEYKEDIKNITPEQKSFNFYSEQVLIAKQYTDQMSQDYVKFCNHICQKKDGDFRLPYVLKINNQITIDEFSKLYLKSGNKLDVILTKIDSLQTNVKYHGKYTDLYLTINKWLNG